MELGYGNCVVHDCLTSEIEGMFSFLNNAWISETLDFKFLLKPKDSTAIHLVLSRRVLAACLWGEHCKRMQGLRCLGLIVARFLSIKSLLKQTGFLPLTLQRVGGLIRIIFVLHL